jgi:hypothetical protein
MYVLFVFVLVLVFGLWFRLYVCVNTLLMVSSFVWLQFKCMHFQASVVVEALKDSAFVKV